MGAWGWGGGARWRGGGGGGWWCDGGLHASPAHPHAHPPTLATHPPTLQVKELEGVALPALDALEKSVSVVKGGGEGGGEGEGAPKGPPRPRSLLPTHPPTHQAPPPPPPLQITTINLERVRKVKTRHQRLVIRCETLR